MIDKKINLKQFRHKPFKFVFFVTRGHRWLLFLTATLVILSEAFFSWVMYFLGKLTDAINNFSPEQNSEIVYHWAWLLIGVFGVSFIFWRISGFLGSYITTQFEAYSLQITFDYLIRHSYEYFSNRLVGKLSSKISNIARSIESMIPMLVWDFLRMAVKFISLLVIIFFANVQLGIIFLIFIFSFLVFNIFVSQKLSRYSKTRADKASELRGNVVDNLTNVMAVQQNVNVEFEIKNIGKYIEAHRFWHLKTWRYFETVLTLNSFFAVIMLATVVLVSLHLWLTDIISIGVIVMAIVMTTRLIGDLVFMGSVFNRFMEQYGQLKEGLEEIFIPYVITDNKDVKNVQITKGKIILKDIKFNYEKDNQKAVFDNLNLEIPAGEKVGLVGESGAGKSTFVSLLLRFMDVDDGEIKIDGYDIKKIKQDDLRRAIAYVPQEALLFHRTIEENIKYSNTDASENEVFRATQRAYAWDFINKFPKKFKTLVGERGVKLSGGQKQRVMIARAMLKKSPILILDEATSSLDSRAEKLIQKALEELMKGRTTLVIAHRLSTLKQMDRIIVFDDGKIIEDGTHEELLSKKGKYWELWQHQLGAL